MAFNITTTQYFDTEGVLQNLIGAIDVPLDTNIELTFSSEVASSSVLSYAITVFRTMPDGGNETPIDVNLTHTEPTKIRIIPTASFIPGASYTLYIPKSNYGIKAQDGTKLQSSFSCNFSAIEASATVADPGTAEVVDVDTIPEELYLASAIPADSSIMQYGLGSIMVSFDGRVPDGGTCSDPQHKLMADCEDAEETWTKDVLVTVEALHPLGHLFNPPSYWIDNVQEPVIVGKDIYLTSKILFDDLSTEEQELLAVIGEDSITSESIVCLNKTADGEGYITFDFDINRTFEVDFDISVNEHTPTLSFMSLLFPFYASINETKLEIGPFVNQYDDFTIALSIHRHSITAAQIWNTTIDALAVPIRITEYVIARTKKDILSTYFTDPAGVGAGSISLGDFKMSGRNLVQYLKDNIGALDLKIIALEHKLKTKDTSTSPYTDHTHQSLPTTTTSAAPRETAGTNFDSLNLGRSFTSKTTSNAS